jgi:hypothetical protein
MSMIVHCPDCGAALSLDPRVAEARVDDGRVLVSLKTTFVKHQCPGGAE